MTRRALMLASVILSVAASGASAQPSGKTPTIGLLIVTSTATTAAGLEVFRGSLKDLGYVEGRSIIIEHRSADGRADRLPGLAAELVARKVDVIVTGGGNISTAAARAATKTIPIVMGSSVGAVEAGFIDTLARPGGNVTGLTVPRGLGAKQLELLRELLPSLARAAILLRPSLSTGDQRVQAKAAALQFFGVTLDYIDVNEPEDLAGAFAAARASRAHALLVAPDPLFFNERARVLEFARSARLPAIYPSRDFVDAGGLMSYGPSTAEVYRSLARYVDRLLKGAKAADLPVEQPTTFDLAINLKTAKALGLAIPPALRVRADQLID